MMPKAGSRFVHIALTGAMVLAGAATAWATDPPPATMAPTAEMRAQMATIHDQMAACLRSEKPVSDCHAEMMKSCRAISPAGQGCQMGAGAMGPGKGTGPHGRMGAPTTPPAAPSGQ